MQKLDEVGEVIRSLTKRFLQIWELSDNEFPMNFMWISVEMVVQI